MVHVDTVLHPTDFSSGAKAAFAYALQVARKRGATLHVLNVAPGPGEHPIRFSYNLEAGEESVYKQAEDKARELITALTEEAGTEDLDVVHARERGMAPGPVIVKYAAEHDVDLIVMGTHGRRGVRRFMSGSVAEEVVRQASCSVMVVRGEKETLTEPPSINRLLVPVDLSEFTIPLFRAAKNVAATYDARIDLLHVIEPLPFPLALMGGVTLDDLVPDPNARVLEQLAHLVKTVEGPEVAVETYAEEGHAAAVIVERAEAFGSDLITIASHGLSGLEGLLLGSVTARVVRQATCPVLVVRVEPEEAPVVPPSETTSA